MTAKKSGQASTDDPAHSSREKALRVAHWALGKKAMDTRLLHVGPLTTIAEYFLICSGRSVRQTRAIAQHIQTQAKAVGLLPLGVEGQEEGSWILLDYDDIVVHVFHQPTRELFSLERLWSDASPVIDPELAREQAEVEYRNGEEDEDWEL